MTHSISPVSLQLTTSQKWCSDLFTFSFFLSSSCKAELLCSVSVVKRDLEMLTQNTSLSVDKSNSGVKKQP